MRFRLLDSFTRDYRRLPKHVQGQADKALALLEKNPRHPSLHTKRVRGTPDIWEARVSLSYRLTFQWERELIILRRLGTHDILKHETS